jgi:hypothetical protein
MPAPQQAGACPTPSRLSMIVLTDLPSRSAPLSAHASPSSILPSCLLPSVASSGVPQNQRNSAVLAEYTRKAEQLAREQQHKDKAAAGGGTHTASPVKSGDKQEETPPPAK